MVVLNSTCHIWCLWLVYKQLDWGHILRETLICMHARVRVIMRSEANNLTMLVTDKWQAPETGAAVGFRGGGSRL